MDQMWESGLFQKDNYNALRDVREAAAIDAMLTLNRDLGVLCGPSSGANLAGSLEYLRGVDESLTERKTAVFIVCDRVEWYMSYIRERRPELFGEAAKPQSLRAFVYNDSGAANDRYSVPVQGADKWIAEHNSMMIDVRGNLAYRMQSIPGSINIAGDLFESMIDSADPFPKDRPILLICPVGEKTARYAAYLQGRGYQAFSLGGGILGWRDAGAQMVRVA
jgi:cysteine synthase B